MNKPSKLQLSNEYAMWTSLFSFGILGTLIALWQITLHNNDVSPVRLSISCEEEGDSMSTTTSASTVVAVVCLLLLVTITRFTERLSKQYICVRDSAMTFSVVQAARRLSGVFILALAFGERLPMSMLVGAACSAVGFGLHWYGG